MDKGQARQKFVYVNGLQTRDIVGIDPARSQMVNSGKGIVQGDFFKPPIMPQPVQPSYRPNHAVTVIFEGGDRLTIDEPVFMQSNIGINEKEPFVLFLVLDHSFQKR